MLVCDLKYFSSHPGLLKVAQWVFSLLVLVCYWALHHYWSGVAVISFTAGSALMTVGLMLIFYLLSLPHTESCGCLHWVLMDLIYCCVFVILYGLSCIMCVFLLMKGLGYNYSKIPDLAMLVFAVLALVAFLMHALWSYARFRTGDTGGSGAIIITTTSRPVVSKTTYVTRQDHVTTTSGSHHY